LTLIVRCSVARRQLCPIYISGAITIWLDTPFEVVGERLLKSDARPLAAGKTPQDLRQLWQLRRPFYEQAEIHIHTGDAAPEAVVEQILKAIQ